ncbi:hypothetical protein [Terriglobus sp. TAA 43]|uniref:hypothetical protein n=1 Tax=Terriglobus sp. TAA 43 TaxID=278961 RepID=UPI000648D9DA|nr:hypothetical protein [Terriglobus sp. TAA 43]
MNTRFYEWAAERCLISTRVASSAKHLWFAFTHEHSGYAEEDFAKWLEGEFSIHCGLTAGICLTADADAYRQAYSAADDTAKALARRVKVNFLDRRAA